jgi:hypothetical protein
VLDRALDFPDVDWLIRSETSPDEAFDIEVTGGWVIVLYFNSGQFIDLGTIGTLLSSPDT